MTTKPSKLLDFIVIGAPKSGTTSLFQYLRFHPQIFIPPAKEIPYFSSKTWRHQGWDQYVETYYAQAPLDLLWGKVTPQYFSNAWVPRKIHAMMPDVRLLVILRHPVDRAFSNYRMAFRTGKESRGFNELALDYVKNNTRINYFTHGEYGTLLSRYLEHYSSNQLLVLFLDDLKNSPETLLDSIWRYLGVNGGYVPSNLGKRYNIGGDKQRFLDIVPMIRKFGIIHRLSQLAPQRHRETIKRRFLLQYNAVSSPPPPIDSEVRWRLLEAYRAEIKILRNTLGIEVPWSEFI